LPDRTRAVVLVDQFLDVNGVQRSIDDGRGRQSPHAYSISITTYATAHELRGALCLNRTNSSRIGRPLFCGVHAGPGKTLALLSPTPVRNAGGLWLKSKSRVGSPTSGEFSQTSGLGSGRPSVFGSIRCP
jgi:hypothetical protein